MKNNNSLVCLTDVSPFIIYLTLKLVSSSIKGRKQTNPSSSKGRFPDVEKIVFESLNKQQKVTALIEALMNFES